MAYTPGLKRKELVLVRKTRRLPVKGKILVNVGDMVSPDTTVATTMIDGPPTVIKVFTRLDILPEEVPKFTVKKVGAEVEKGEVIARYRAFWGLTNKVCKSPVKGTLEHISDVSGQVIIREPPIPVEIKAYIPGRVIDVLPEEGVVVETPAAFIQGIFGIGSETHGKIMIMPEEILKANDLNNECAGKILVTKRLVELEALRKAASLGVRGIVSGGIIEKELAELMGYSLGVAITGEEKVGLVLIVTEGFGKELSISEETLAILKKFEGFDASVNGATQIRAGVIRPEIIIPHEFSETSQLKDVDVEDTEVVSQGLNVGTLIRIIGDPYFGALGHVTGLPPELQDVETESKVRVLEAQLDDGRRVVIPRANVEIIGE